MSAPIVSTPIDVERMRTDFTYFCYVLGVKEPPGVPFKFNRAQENFYATMIGWSNRRCFCCNAKRGDNDQKVAFVAQRRVGHIMVPVCSDCSNRRALKKVGAV